MLCFFNTRILFKKNTTNTNILKKIILTFKIPHSVFVWETNKLTVVLLNLYLLLILVERVFMYIYFFLYVFFNKMNKFALYSAIIQYFPGHVKKKKKLLLFILKANFYSL